MRVVSLERLAAKLEQKSRAGIELLFGSDKIAAESQSHPITLARADKQTQRGYCQLPLLNFLARVFLFVCVAIRLVSKAHTHTHVYIAAIVSIWKPIWSLLQCVSLCAR